MLPDLVRHAIEAYFPDRPLRLHPAGEGDYCRAFGVNGEWTFLFAKHPFASACLRRDIVKRASTASASKSEAA